MMKEIYIISDKPVKLVTENSLIVDENEFVKMPINSIENCECGIITLDKE
jgi:hypothetical protein